MATEYGDTADTATAKQLAQRMEAEGVKIPPGATLSFKDEGFEDGQTIGPVKMWDPAKDPMQMVPFGQPHPAQVYDFGWQTRGAARALAKRLHLSLETF